MSQGKIRVQNEPDNWGLPDGSHVTIPGGVYSLKQLVKVVNQALREAKKPYRYNRKGEITNVAPIGEDGDIPPVEVDLSGMAAQLPPPLQFWTAMQAIVSFCEKEKDPSGWLLGKRMYDKFIEECKPEGWPPSFRAFVEVNFPDFEIPATVRSGIVLASSSDLTAIRAAQQKLDGENR